MTARHAKQIIYGAFYLIFFAALFSIFYFLLLKPAPSCFDGKQNQNEEGADCGGVCAKSCLPVGLRGLEIRDRILTFQTSPGRISVLARVSNPNFNQAARNFRYEFLFLDAGGNTVQSFSGDSFIYAGEAKYILLPNIVAGAGFAKIELKTGNYAWVPRAIFGGLPNFEISGAATETRETNTIVSGRILNKDTVAFSKITIFAVFRGSFGQIAGASETEIKNLAPNETRQFSILYPAIPSVDAAATQVYAYAERR